MSNFTWNINFLIFWRLAWLRKLPEGYTVTMDGWGHIGRLYFTTQTDPVGFYIKPLGKKIKNLIAKD
ncbi:hypothetical protein VPT02_101 [Vibrio phage VPT02]|uniref:Uncharacterized protein n=1 Tax=Vibrio phage pVp-1 TaxID=1150989 RepID=H6WXD4_9CAUD|nr:hypothetical protein F404_gp043 [Vibrio phage pVp-1]AFB83900.1 hypothetical protein pVp-1_0043 [Vibrio phage pVp-1]QIG60677.1 hypothetical protein VPT02_101 [Vibrio phage VPT02]